VGVVTKAWNKGFADCGGHIVLRGCGTEDYGVMILTGENEFEYLIDGGIGTV
jgi:hypothetical protein